MSLISLKHEGGLRVSAGIRQHQLRCDVAPEEGGTDTGPTPVELLAAAMGACMALHIARYCQAAKLSHAGFGIDVDFQLVKDPLRVGALTVDITLPPGFPENRKEAVKRAALQCTVKNTLRDDTAVDVEVWASTA